MFSRGLRSILILFVCVACLERYYPPVNAASLSALVVDGFIATDGSASVKLTRSIPLNSSVRDMPDETGATVTIESSNGEIFPLTEGEPAVYSGSGFDVAFEDKYTLRIHAVNGDEYISEAVQVYPTPPVGDVYFGVSATGQEIEVYVDASDNNPGATGFYLWDCIETYEYQAPVYVAYKINPGGSITERQPEDLIYTCWRNDIVPSTMMSTKRLSDNTIAGHRVAVLERGSDKISVRYSILVRQRAINEVEYAFRTQLQRSTEQQGSLFAQIPGAVISNVRSLSNSDEYVLGYFHGQHIQERRFFIDWEELPEYFRLPHSLAGCQPETTCLVIPGASKIGCIDVSILSANYLVLSANNDSRAVPQSYNVISTACGDCRYKGGTLTRPPFW